MMGKRGPRPQPTELKVLHGARRDRINTAEPQPAAGEVVAPELSAAAREVWDRLAPDLEAKGVLTPWDADEFAGFCDAVARRDEAARQLDKHGEVIRAPVFDRNGKPTGQRIVTSPWLSVWKAATDAVLRYGSRFGLSPSDRSQIKTSVPIDLGGVERFFS